MKQFLKKIKHSDFFAFNLRNRDLWVAAQAAKAPCGARVLDIGAGSAPYRALFSHCDYRTQDLPPFIPINYATADMVKSTSSATQMKFRSPMKAST
jgi:hypothetical protein